jgi:hypothetical protein
MNSALSQRLQQARHRLFVGRTAEITSWKRALDAPQWSIPIWHVHGLGGMGKTSLLREWKLAAQERGMRVLSLDARDFDPTADSFCAALHETIRETLGLEVEASASPEKICALINTIETRAVLQIDTYELLAPLDGWLRDSFLPHLPDNCALNFAGRDALPMTWHSDAGWQELVNSFDLSALSVDESSDYLQRRGVVVTAQANLLSWAHGHPLALSLAADVWLQKPELSSPESEELLTSAGDFDPGDVPELVGSLLGHLVREVPTKAHRAALEACATVALMTEELLRDMLASLLAPVVPHVVPHEEGAAEFPTPEPRQLFDWLRSLSIIQSNRHGLFPHDLAREVLVADLRWRNPQWQTQLHSSAREHYLRRIHHSSGSEQQRAIFDCIFLHRMSPAVAPYLQWHDSRCSLDSARAADVLECLNWVERHEGAASRAIAARWFAVQPKNLTIVRDPRGNPQGFVFQLALQAATPEEIAADPAAAAAWSYLGERAPLRGGEKATFFRFWMDKDCYQNVGETQSLIFVQAARHYIVTPQLAFTFFQCAEPQFWGAGFAYADLAHVPECDFEIGGHTYGNFCHDWRSRPVLDWIDLLTQREMQSVAREAPATAELAPEANFSVLDEAAFHSAVRRALRQWSDPVSLRQNPLLETALVHRRARTFAAISHAPTADEHLLALRSLLREAVAALGGAPRQDRAYRALELVYGRRTLSQESAADVMSVSHSSFRRYLRAALLFIGELLWHRETARIDGEAPISLINIENERNLNLF